MHRIRLLDRHVSRQLRKDCNRSAFWNILSTPIVSVARVRHRARSSACVWASVTAGITSVMLIDKQNLGLCQAFDLPSSAALVPTGRNDNDSHPDVNFGRIDEEPIEKRTLIVCGTDRRGRPTLVARPSFHVSTSKKESLEAVVACMHTVRQALMALPSGESQILVLYDLGGAGYRNLDMTFSRQLIEGLFQEFPDLLEKVLVINGHWSVVAAWSAIEVLLPHETRRKVTFCGKDYKEKLLEFIDAGHPYLLKLQAA